MHRFPCRLYTHTTISKKLRTLWKPYIILLSFHVSKCNENAVSIQHNSLIPESNVLSTVRTSIPLYKKANLNMESETKIHDLFIFYLVGFLLISFFCSAFTTFCRSQKKARNHHKKKDPKEQLHSTI